jgi:hypothetical protein
MIEPVVWKTSIYFATGMLSCKWLAGPELCCSTSTVGRQRPFGVIHMEKAFLVATVCPCNPRQSLCPKQWGMCELFLAAPCRWGTA